MKTLKLVLLVIVALFTANVYAQVDTSALQQHLMNPWVLFGFMIFGSILSMVKQWGQAKMDGSSATMATYLSHLQELLTTLGGNAIAFFLLVDSGNLNFIAAVSIGYVLNSAADLNPLGGRSITLAGKKE